MRGRLCYTFGALLFVVSGALHAVAHSQPPPPDQAELHESMAKATQTFAGMTFTVAGAVELLSWYTTTFSVLVGLLALAMVRRCGSDAWLLRTLSFLLAIGAGVLAAFAFNYGVAPPAVLYTATALLFVAAVVRAEKPAPA